MIKKFTQFKGSKSNDNKSQVFKPFELSGVSPLEESKDLPIKKEKAKESPKAPAAAEKIKVQESFIPINAPSFEKIIKDLQSKISPLAQIESESETESDLIGREFNDHEEEIAQEVPEPIEEPLIGYKIFRDKAETFECKISIEGANPQNSSVRLILDSNEWNLVFYGRIDQNGKCVIPLKKISVLSEKCKGEIRLEVIADDTLFVPWKESFVVVPSKKVTVEILSGGRNNPENPAIKVTGIKGQ